MRKYLYYLLILIGLLQIIGYITGSKAVRGLGAVFVSSPLPIVFTEVKGLETFASEFYICYKDQSGKYIEERISPEMYSRLEGPYNRRNIYGAAIAYGPVMDSVIWNSILGYGLCNGHLATEMGIPENGSDYAIRIKTRTAGKEDEWILKPSCK
jgi:hypothetical protein